MNLEKKIDKGERYLVLTVISHIFSLVVVRVLFTLRCILLQSQIMFLVLTWLQCKEMYLCCKIYQLQIIDFFNECTI